MNLYTVAVFLITYLICSINPAIEICKKKTGEDIRKLGSGTAGSANAIRVLGRVLGSAVVLLDIGKVFLSYFIVKGITTLSGGQEDIFLKSIFIVAVVIGHCFPIYYKFNGGKGVIVGITAATILDPKIAIVCIIAGFVILLITRVVAMATLGGLILYLIMSVVMMPEYIVPVAVISAIVMYKHRANIHRILTKQEAKIK
ncbi:MAG: glycerol-3-phosphate acyltransferase [Clostridia bacterium]